ncbi:uncharacterized protein LOC108674919 [Hyalella azteca]|uniref:Uncharacterized protein LOC108674919 n=1 Tax=Hyalella azteca TaxID=294128 RepID=A0A8B7NX63_HYAAZ|nr:uncharacterized protein LOC108674919 [Hyalella azteca]
MVAFRKVNSVVHQPLLDKRLIIQFTILTFTLTVASSAHNCGSVPTISSSSLERWDTSRQDPQLVVDLEQEFKKDERTLNFQFKINGKVLKVSFKDEDGDHCSVILFIHTSSYCLYVNDDACISLSLYVNTNNFTHITLRSERDEHSMLLLGAVIGDLGTLGDDTEVQISRNSEETSTDCPQGNASTKAPPSSIPTNVVVPVAVCSAFILIIIIIFVVFMWQRNKWKKRRHYNQQRILNDQEERQRFSQTQLINTAPSVPPRSSYDPQKGISIIEDDEQSLQVKQGHEYLVECVADVTAHHKVRTYLREQAMLNSSATNACINGRQNSSRIADKNSVSFSKLTQERPKKCASRQKCDSNELSIMNSARRGENPHVAGDEEEDEQGGHTGPYWHHSLRQPHCQQLKNYKV